MLITLSMPKNFSYPELETAKENWKYIPQQACLKGKNILVTGASSGIGSTAAKTFASYGANIILLGRNQERLESNFDWIENSTNTKPVIVPCDLLRLTDESADSLYDAIQNSYGELHGILHSAALLGTKIPISDYQSEEWSRVMQVNAFAPFLLTRTLLPLMTSNKESASIIFLSSTVGRKGRAYWGAYAMSKKTIEGLMEVLSDEHANINDLKINTVNPGATRTPMRAMAYPAENAKEVPPAEEKMDLLIYLMESTTKKITGEALSSSDWSPKRLELESTQTLSGRSSPHRP